MASFLPWINENWFSLIQSIGIVAGLFFTGVTLRHDLRARRVSQYLTLANQHRHLWSALYRHPKLTRLTDPDRDISKDPVSKSEQAYLKLVFVHFHTGWLVAREGSLTPLSTLALDVALFVNLPAPANAWSREKAEFESSFVNFMEEARHRVRRVSR
jgi:hypothetical protein